MNILFYSHNISHYRLFKKLQRVINQSNNYLDQSISTILDNGEYRLSKEREKVDYWIEKYYKDCSFNEEYLDSILSKYPSFNLGKWIEIDRVISFYRSYLNLPSLSIIEIKRFSAACILGFEDFFKYNDIDYIFSELILGIQDAILYEVAKTQGISWIGIRNSRISNGIVFCDPYTEIPIEFNYYFNKYQKLKEAVPNETLNKVEYFIKSRKDNRKLPAYMRFTSKKGSFLSLRHIFRFLQILISLPNRNVKSNNFTIIHLKHRIIYWLKRARNLYAIRYSNKIKKNFCKLNTLKGKKYIIFPLQFEPEATASVRAYPNHNQIDIIKHISLSLEEDTLLVVKEHKGNEGYRKLDDYIEISRLKNVLLVVDRDSSNRDLINDSLGVITINSTLALEAYLNEKPVIILGNSYWMNLPRLTRFDHYEDITTDVIGNFFKCINESSLTDLSDEYINYFSAYTACIQQGTFLSKDKSFLKSQNINYILDALTKYKRCLQAQSDRLKELKG